MPRGGYRKPSNPAPVSGPGALSRRTDGGPGQAMRDLPDAKYGENRDFRAAESVSPMAAAPSPSAAGGAPTSPPAAPFDHPMGDMPTPLTDGTLAPDEPVTAGAPLGAGPNSMTLPPAPDAVLTARSVLERAAANGGSQAAALLARIQNGL